MLHGLELDSPINLSYRAYLQANKEGSEELSSVALKLYRRSLAQGSRQKKVVNSLVAQRHRIISAQNRLRKVEVASSIGTVVLPFIRKLTKS